jgi:hypothetical protein
MITRLFTFLLILLALRSAGQSAKDQLKIANAAKAGLTDFYKEIPFTDRGGYFIIPVTIGSQTYDYIFETGGYNTVTSDIMKNNALPELMKVTVGSSNQVKSKVVLSKIPMLQVSGVPFTDVGVFQFDFTDAPLIKCYTTGGLLGKGVIAQAVWQVDYPNKIIRVADRVDKMPNLENAIKLKVELDKVFNPFIQVTINGRTQKCLLDFGYGGFLSLTEKTARESAFTNTLEARGEGAVGANGATQEVTYLSTVASAELGGIKISDQVAFHSASNNYNLIGTELASYFIVTLNFKERELLLTPMKEFPQQTFQTFGINMNRDEKSIYISKIYKGLDGDKKGIQLRDQVVSVNGIPTDSLNLCDSFFKFQRMLKESNSVHIKVKRDDTERDFNLRKTTFK